MGYPAICILARLEMTGFSRETLERLAGILSPVAGKRATALYHGLELVTGNLNTLGESMA